MKIPDGYHMPNERSFQKMSRRSRLMSTSWSPCGSMGIAFCLCNNIADEQNYVITMWWDMRCNKVLYFDIIAIWYYMCVWTSSWAHIYEYLILLCKIGCDNLLAKPPWASFPLVHGGSHTTNAVGVVSQDYMPASTLRARGLQTPLNTRPKHRASA
jgi:hypothetical protein